MANLNGFNANEVEPTAPFEPLPAGKYVAAITASETKPTKKGDGSYLQLEFTVLDGDCKGRKVWDRLCINHPKRASADHDVGAMRRWARAQLASLQAAIDGIRTDRTREVIGTYVDRIIVWPSQKRGEMVLNASAQPLWKHHDRLEGRSWCNKVGARGRG